jgi:hypothetical protein
MYEWFLNARAEGWKLRIARDGVVKDIEFL